MKTFFINRFKKGRWLNKSNSILNDKAKMTALLSKLPIYLKKEGLKRVKEDLLLLKDYISDIETITSERERISTELSLATRIQENMLPNIFPAFPDRPGRSCS